MRLGKTILSLAAGLVLMTSAQAAGEKKDLWVPVEPMDHKKTEAAVDKAVLESGASTTPENIQPFSRRLDAGNPVFPQDFYFFIIGCDLKLYPDTQAPPQGQRKLLAVSLTRVKDYWVSNSSISYSDKQGQYVHEDNPTLKKPGDVKRWDHFKDSDPEQAVLAVLRGLQEEAKIFNPAKPSALSAGCKEKKE